MYRLGVWIAEEGIRLPVLPLPLVASLRSDLMDSFPPIAPSASPYISWAEEVCVADTVGDGARRSVPLRILAAYHYHVSSRRGFPSGVECS